MVVIINYVITGNGRRTLLFLHGWGGSTASFYSLATLLGDTYKCVIADMYGHGDTPADRVYTLADYTQSVSELLDFVGCDEVTVIAHSFGGRVAADLAVKDGRVRALVLIASAGLRPRRGFKYLARKTKYYLRKALRLSVANCGSPDYLSLSPMMKKTFVNIVNTHQDDIFPLITQPALLIWGNRDSDTPPYMAHKMHRFIRSSRLIISEGGHFMYLEKSKMIENLIRNFLNGVYYG